MVGAFALTMLVETPLFVLGLKKDKRQAMAVCLGANLASYLILTLLSFQFTYFPDNGLRDHWRFGADGSKVNAEPVPVMEPLERPKP